MQLTNHTEKQIEPINPVNVAATVKGIVPRSFEKTFNGLSSEQVAYAFKICLDGLTREQISTGMSAVRDNGYCPDPAMFRKWCLGIKGFINDIDPVASSYRGKYAALNDVYTWIEKKHTTEITEASFLAYERSYTAFNELKWANSYDRAKRVADSVFMDNYEEVVKGLIERGVKQEMHVNPIELPKPKKEEFEALPIGSDKHNEQLEKLRELLKR